MLTLQGSDEFKCRLQAAWQVIQHAPPRPDGSRWDEWVLRYLTWAEERDIGNGILARFEPEDKHHGPMFVMDPRQAAADPIRDAIIIVHEREHARQSAAGLPLDAVAEKDADGETVSFCAAIGASYWRRWDGDREMIGYEGEGPAHTEGPRMAGPGEWTITPVNS